MQHLTVYLMNYHIETILNIVYTVYLYLHRTAISIKKPSKIKGLNRVFFYQCAITNLAHIQVHLNKLECCEKVHFFL